MPILNIRTNQTIKIEGIIIGGGVDTIVSHRYIYKCMGGILYCIDEVILKELLCMRRV